MRFLNKDNTVVEVNNEGESVLARTLSTEELLLVEPFIPNPLETISVLDRITILETELIALKELVS